jgi:cysteine desulfurase/selenocysteine lyase
MGIGGLIVRRELLESGEMRPWLFGGGMIESVQTDQTEFNQDIAERFTAGTPDVASAAGLAAACDYLSQLGMSQVADHDRDLAEHTIEQLQQLANIQIVGPVEPLPGQQLDRLGSVSFIYQGAHAHDVAQVLDSEGVAVRSGHHCTMPLHLHFEWQATTRASFQVYNDRADVDQLITGLKKVAKVFG